MGEWLDDSGLDLQELERAVREQSFDGFLQALRLSGLELADLGPQELQDLFNHVTQNRARLMHLRAASTAQKKVCEMNLTTTGSTTAGAPTSPATSGVGAPTHVLWAGSLYDGPSITRPPVRPAGPSLLRPAGEAEGTDGPDLVHVAGDELLVFSISVDFPDVVDLHDLVEAHRQEFAQAVAEELAEEFDPTTNVFVDVYAGSAETVGVASSSRGRGFSKLRIRERVTAAVRRVLNRLRPLVRAGQPIVRTAFKVVRAGLTVLNLALTITRLIRLDPEAWEHLRDWLGRLNDHRGWGLSPS